VLAERARLDASEHEAAVTIYLELTAYAVDTLSPRELEELAAWLKALLEREPTRSAQAYAPHRIVLGTLADQLRGYARLAGEPVGLEADLRAATSQAEERRIRARIADQRAAFDREFDAQEAAEQAQLRARDEEAWTRPSGDWLADAVAESDHEGQHDHEEESPAETTAPPAESDNSGGSTWLL